jgi:hypothetical protein
MSDLAASGGAGDGNRTRMASLDRAWIMALTSKAWTCEYLVTEDRSDRG